MSANIYDLHPDLQQPCKDFLAQCADTGLHVKITFTWRSVDEQNALYAQGRTKPGMKVTNLQGNQSLHCFTIDGQPASKAFDFAIFDTEGNYIKNGSDKRYTQAGEIGEGLNLEWGGRFRTFHDPDHLELRS